MGDLEQLDVTDGDELCYRCSGATVNDQHSQQRVSHSDGAISLTEVEGIAPIRARRSQTRDESTGRFHQILVDRSPL